MMNSFPKTSALFLDSGFISDVEGEDEELFNYAHVWRAQNISQIYYYLDEAYIQLGKTHASRGKEDQKLVVLPNPTIQQEVRTHLPFLPQYLKIGLVKKPCRI